MHREKGGVELQKTIVPVVPFFDVRPITSADPPALVRLMLHDLRALQPCYHHVVSMVTLCLIPLQYTLSSTPGTYSGGQNHVFGEIQTNCETLPAYLHPFWVHSSEYSKVGDVVLPGKARSLLTKLWRLGP